MINVNDSAFVDYCVGLTEQVVDMSEELVKIGDRFSVLCETVEKLHSLLDTLNDAVHDIRELDEIQEEPLTQDVEGYTELTPEVQEPISGDSTFCSNTASHQPTGFNTTNGQYNLPF